MRRLTNLVRKLYGQAPIPRSLEEWAYDTAKIATADDIIVASIIQSFAKDFDDWEFRGDFDKHRRHWLSEAERIPDPTLTNRKRGIVVTFARDAYTVDHGFARKSFVDMSSAKINGDPITSAAAKCLSKSWREISAAVKAANDAAAKAKADMEANERKWNLAEKLLGMKRNEFGALVPIETAS